VKALSIEILAVMLAVVATSPWCPQDEDRWCEKKVTTIDEAFNAIPGFYQEPEAAQEAIPGR
jgi:hypothetical protein